MTKRVESRDPRGIASFCLQHLDPVRSPKLAKASYACGQFIGIHSLAVEEQCPLVEDQSGANRRPLRLQIARLCAPESRKTPIVVNDARFFLFCQPCIIPYANEGARNDHRGLTAPQLTALITRPQCWASLWGRCS